MVLQDASRSSRSQTSRSKRLRFVKLQGAGNDFVLLDSLQQPLPLDDLPALAQRLCQRKFGVGADGLLIVEPSPCADYRMRIFNADGSEATMCGNGIRCFARYLLEYHAPNAHAFTIETGVGVRRVFRTDGEQLTVEMGRPHTERVGEFTVVFTGARHVTLFVDDLDAFPLKTEGATIERHPAFPDRVNVSAAQVERSDSVRARVWERGVGETLACGTGACALVVAGATQGLLQRKATVRMPGGVLLVEWRADDTLWLTGDAAVVFEGVWRG